MISYFTCYLPEMSKPILNSMRHSGTFTSGISAFRRKVILRFIKPGTRTTYPQLCGVILSIMPSCQLRLTNANTRSPIVIWREKNSNKIAIPQICLYKSCFQTNLQHIEYYFAILLLVFYLPFLYSFINFLISISKIEEFL